MKMGLRLPKLLAPNLTKVTEVKTPTAIVRGEW